MALASHTPILFASLLKSTFKRTTGEKCDFRLRLGLKKADGKAAYGELGYAFLPWPLYLGIVDLPRLLR